MAEVVYPGKWDHTAQISCLLHRLYAIWTGTTQRPVEAFHPCPTPVESKSKEAGADAQRSAFRNFVLNYAKPKVRSKT